MMTTDASKFEPPTIPQQTRRKKSFYAEEEDIEVKPSTELIPDEYEHAANESVLFHIFRSATNTEEGLAEELLHCVQEINYDVNSEKNLHEMNNNSQFFKDLEAIRNEAVKKSALLLIFIGFFGKQDGTLQMINEPETHKTVHIKEIWNMFASNNCPELKYKPKIFIFCTSQKPSSTVQTDSMRHRLMEFDKVYDFPAEADMLIVYKKVQDPFSRHMETFLIRFCDNIATYSKKHDIIDIISYINNNDQKYFPLIISTLTRKFYLTPNSEREHLLSVVENHHLLEETLQKIHRDVEKLHEAKKKKEKKFSFSFKKKSEDKPKIAKKKENAAIAENPKDSKLAVPPSPSSSSSFQRLSGGTVPGRRSRQVSETDSSGVKGKPKWKY